ncbi:MAG: septum formation inhibitor Maf, partial [Actinobacteria bacterium]|nr:septum formation inhibitor Maf [Actinomycetota bacterium]
MVQVILASASPSRLRLLESVGITPSILVSGVDEDASEFESLSPAELVIALAILKAHTVKDKAPVNSLIIGCDSTFEFEGKSLGKPVTKTKAIERCKPLRGKTGYLHTGHCLIDLRQGIELSERSTAKVQFAQMTDAEIIDYVDSDEPLNVAGGFTLDGLSAPFITKIEGDPSGIIGLSLPL